MKRDKKRTSNDVLEMKQFNNINKCYERIGGDSKNKFIISVIVEYSKRDKFI